jgi:transcriptional regulator with XRE-family HTH domain
MVIPYRSQTIQKNPMLPGSRLRHARYRLGLTFRDVGRASYQLASLRGHADFIIHISRLAAIENQGAIPGLHKLYALAAIYHLNPLDILNWYDVPMECDFSNGAEFSASCSHFPGPPNSMRLPMQFDPRFDSRRTELLSRMVQSWKELEGVFFRKSNRYLYG